MPQLTDDECIAYCELQRSADAFNEDEIDGLNVALAEGMKLETYIKKVREERTKVSASQKDAEPEPEN
jgi:uncharacterized coiled-coil protein SlyX